MLQILILSTITALAISLPLTSSPLLLGLWILLIALSIAVWISVNTLAWFRIILFLIYISGILVIFAYFVAITPNQAIPFKFLSTSLLILLITCTINFFFKLTYSTHFSVITYFPIQQYIFSSRQGPILILLVILLFYAIVFTVKITDQNQGPLRPFE